MQMNMQSTSTVRREMPGIDSLIFSSPRQQGSHRVTFVLAFMLVLSACTVQYVSRYDAATEQSITNIQRSVEGLLQSIEGNLGTPESDYEHYTDVYEELHVDAALLNTRAQAIEMNSITAEQSALLMGWLQNLEALHKTGIPNSPEVLMIPRQQAEQIFVAMLRFELAKKRELVTPTIDGE